jgi:mRNA interferase RelE/StbE
VNYRLSYTKKSLSDLERLDKKIAKRILDKLLFYIEQKEPLHFAKPLNDSDVGEYRFKIGDYRASFDLDKDGKIHILYILHIKHRKDIYK